MSSQAFHSAEHSMRGYLKSVILKPEGNYTDIRGFLELVRPQIHQQLIDELLNLGSVKFNLALKVKLIKSKPDGGEEYMDPVFHYKQETLLDSSEVKDVLDGEGPKLTESLERYTNKGSGWVVDEVDTLWLDVANYKPFKGGSYIKLPTKLKDKQFAVNIQNKDAMCLLCAILAALFPPPPGKNVSRPSGYLYPKTVLNLDGIDFPTPISQITKIEKQNNLAINVFGWEKNSPVVYRISEQPENIKKINILVITENDKLHYLWIKHFSRFLYDQSKYKCRKYFC